jgi:hypothetical protein
MNPIMLIAALRHTMTLTLVYIPLYALRNAYLRDCSGDDTVLGKISELAGADKSDMTRCVLITALHRL